MKKRIITSLVYALLMIFAQICYFNANWIFTPEDAIVSRLDKLAELVHRKKYPADIRFLFINTGYDNTLARIETPYGDSGTLAITNREYSARLLRQLADKGNQHRYLLWDIRYDLTTPDDSLLRCQFSRMERVVVPRDEKGDSSHELSQHTGSADYRSYGGHFLRTALFDASAGKSLPYVMYEDFNQLKPKYSSSGLFERNGYSPVTVFPHYYIKEDDEIFHEITLKRICELLEMPDSSIYQDFVRGKILVVGNFTEDRHITRAGLMPGSLILLNTFLTLQSGLHLIRFTWVLFVAVFFSMLVYFELYVRPQTDQQFSRWHLVRRILEPGIIAGLICFLSLLFFGMPISISGTVLALYIIPYIENP